jgi:hypothetical protein
MATGWARIGRTGFGSEVDMQTYTPDFLLDVQALKGVGPAGEIYAKAQRSS